MKRAALYVRVSTMEQAKEGYSIPAQTSKLKAFAMAKDMVVSKVYTDPGFSGAKLDRPALQEMITDIQKNKIDVVLVYKLDRLSRSQKNTLYLIEDIFLKNEVDFISMQESFDTSTPFGRATIGMLSVFAQLERDTITERMSMGRAERAKKGHYHGSGFVPIGYDYVDGKLLINDYEAQIVREIFDLYVNEGKGVHHITKRMALKYPEKVKTLTIVKYALRNPVYLGKIQWEEQLYDGLHEPIIDSETFDKAQDLIAEKSLIHGGEQHGNQLGLLLGIIYCGHCGAKLFRHISGKVNSKYHYTYYTCRSVKGTVPSLVTDPNCTQPSMRQELAEEKVINALKSLDFKNIKLRLSKRNNTSTDEIKVFEKELIKKEQQKKKILDLYQYGTIDADTLNDRIKSIVIEVDTLQRNIDSLRSSPLKITEERLEDLRAFDWDNETIENKILMINEFVERIEITDQEMSITYKF